MPSRKVNADALQNAPNRVHSVAMTILEEKPMSRIKAWLLAGAVLLGLISAMAQAQTNVRVRGTITGFDGHVLEVKTREGNDLNVYVTDNSVVSSLVELKMGDIKQGGFVGVTAVKKGYEGSLYALEVHVFPEASRGTGEGHYDWDLGPGTTMTNANVDAIVERNDGKELKLSYKGGMQKIIVPPGTPIVTFVPAEQSQLKAGVPVFAVVQQAEDGTLTAKRILIGKDGMKPPM
jgi:hypothetical protein